MVESQGHLDAIDALTASQEHPASIVDQHLQSFTAPGTCWASRRSSASEERSATSDSTAFAPVSARDPLQGRVATHRRGARR